MDDITLTEPNTLNGNIILAERIVSNEFFVKEVSEKPFELLVTAVIEMGPFETREVSGRMITTGTKSRTIVVWEKEDYSQVELIWDNTMLVNRIKEILNSEVITV